MAVHTAITRISDAALTPTCDLCGFGPGGLLYHGRTPVAREVRDSDKIIDKWTESTWHLCPLCAALADQVNMLGLARRITMLRGQGKVDTKTATKIAASFLENLTGQRENSNL